MRVGLVAQAEEELARAMDLSTNDYERRLVRNCARSIASARRGASGALTSLASLAESQSPDTENLTMTKERHIAIILGHRSTRGRSRNRSVRRATDTRCRGRPNNGCVAD